MADDVLLTDAEWRATLMGARALRAVSASQSRAGADTLARERARDADVLEGLARRAVVQAEHRTDLPTPAEQAYAMYEALTDPVGEAEREREAIVTDRMEPSDDVLRDEFRDVCEELGLPASRDHGAEIEAER
jgi:hypothetical protein